MKRERRENVEAESEKRQFAVSVAFVFAHFPTFLSAVLLLSHFPFEELLLR